MFKTISCPYCSYQYLPGEIFTPKEFLGQPKNVVRDACGEILGFEGIEMTDTETYICDNCGKEFTVKTRFSFIVENDKKESLKPVSLFYND